VSLLAGSTLTRKSIARSKSFRKLSKSCAKALRGRPWPQLCEAFVEGASENKCCFAKGAYIALSLCPVRQLLCSAILCGSVVIVMETPRDPNASRYEHVGKGLRRGDLDRDPIKQFGNWLTAAIEAGIRDVNAMSLATAGAY